MHQRTCDTAPDFSITDRTASFFRHHYSLALLAVLLFANICSAQNKALKLDGRGSYVELPPNIFRDLTQATVEVWAKWERFQNYSRVFEFGGPWQSMSLFNHADKPDLRFNLYPSFAKTDPSAQNVIRIPGVLHSNEWIHLAAVTGPGGMELYANGRLIGQHTNIASFADLKVFQTNLIGRGLTGNRNDRDFQGEIDELRVWNHRRSAAQIRANMFKRLSGKEDGLVHLWNFDDGSANDAVSSAHGKLIGTAIIVPTDLGLVAEAAPVAATAPTNSPTANAMSAAAAVPTNTNSATMWWIAGPLIALVVLLAWLAVMLRRSGLGSTKLLAAAPMHALPPGTSVSSAGATPALQDEVKQRALTELTEFAKESLVQGLYSQRKALLEAHQKAQQELAELEARVVSLRLPERIRAYEKRIVELEGQLETRDEELHELTRATLQILRQRLAEEKEKESHAPRFN